MAFSLKRQWDAQVSLAYLRGLEVAELKEEDMPMVNKKGCIKAPLNKHMILEPYGVQLSLMLGPFKIIPSTLLEYFP